MQMPSFHISHWKLMTALAQLFTEHSRLAQYTSNKDLKATVGQHVWDAVGQKCQKTLGSNYRSLPFAARGYHQGRTSSGRKCLTPLQRMVYATWLDISSLRPFVPDLLKNCPALLDPNCSNQSESLLSLCMKLCSWRASISPVMSTPLLPGACLPAWLRKSIQIHSGVQVRSIMQNRKLTSRAFAVKAHSNCARS